MTTSLAHVNWQSSIGKSRLGDSHTVNTSLDCYPCVIHVTPNVGEDLKHVRAQSFLTCNHFTFAFKPSLHIASQSFLDCSDATGLVNSIYVPSIRPVCMTGLSSKLYIVHAKVIQRPSNLNLFCSVEKGIRKLFSFSQGTLNDFEARNVTEVVADGCIGAFVVRVWIMAWGYVCVVRMCYIKELESELLVILRSIKAYMSLHW